MKTARIIDQFHELLLEEHRISAKSKLRNWANDVSGMGSSFMKIWEGGISLRIGSRNAWKPMLNVNGTSRLSNFWNFFGSVGSNVFLSRLMAMDEIWLHHYDPETKQQSMTCRHNVSPRNHHKNFLVQIYDGKFLDSVLGGLDGILLTEFIQKGQTINAECYSSLLVQLKDILKKNANAAFGS